MSPDRIDEHAVLLEAVVEVRTCGQAGCADAPDQIPLMDAGPSTHGDRRQMQVLGFEAVRMTQMHHAAGAAAHTGFDDKAVRDRDDRRAGRRPVIDAEMRAVLAENGMQAAA